MSAQDELTTTACLALQRLTPIKKAQFLLNNALSMIEDRQYGEEVETYLGVCLKTPGLPKEDMEKALLAQSNARKLAGGSNRPLISTQPQLQIHFPSKPACQRIPPEIWDQIAAQTPKYHLRKWLFVSQLHREVASRHIFHTVHIYFREFENLNPGLDLLERAINDPIFARQVKSLNLHLDYEDGDTSDVILRLLNISLHAFKALREFEWSGNLDMPTEMVQVLSHKRLHGLGLKGSCCDADTLSAFRNLRKFALHVEHDDDFGEPELEDVRAVLDQNESTLKQLIVDDCPYFEDELDLVFESETITNLTHIDLFAPGVSGSVLGRISKAKNLRSLTLHGSFAEPDYASQIFATHGISLPHLESFRFLMEDEIEELQYSVVYFLWKREKLRRLDLGDCPWDTIQPLLPGLRNLRVLAVYFDELSQEQIESLVEAIPTQMVAIKLSVDVSHLTLDEYAPYFTRFYTLSFLHLQLSIENFHGHANKSLCSMRIAAAVPSLDFLSCNGSLYIVMRTHGDMGPTVEVKEIPTNSYLEYGSGVDVVSEDIAWLQQKTYRWNLKAEE